MRGPEGAAKLTAEHLAARLPHRLALLETALELDVGELGTPALVLPHDRLTLAVDEWPAILVVGQQLRSLGAGDVRLDGSEVYRARYAVRVFVWVRDEDELTTDLRRKRYVLAVREALLERKNLTPPATYGSGDYADDEPEITTDPLTIFESYSDVVLDDVSTLAGAYLDVDVIVEEVLTGTIPLGNVLNPVVIGTALEGDTATIPPHPGLT